jgi:DNA modification methylase
MKKTKLMLGDNIESLKKLPDNSVDSVVTDPPYGLSAPKNSGKTSQGGFMNKKWDYDVPSVEFWSEVYRVLKPGGHVLSFGGTRTYHRMVVNIEDAGFEIRDQIQWIYGSGFPKSHNIGKAVDKLEGNERVVVGTLADLNPRYNTPRKGGDKYGDGFGESEVAPPLTKGTSPYEGWGTALKPANEPICVARKPLSEKSVAENVLKWGTGGINVDGCRVGTDEKWSGNKKEEWKRPGLSLSGSLDGTFNSQNSDSHDLGRFPANIILECICDEVIKGEKGEIKISNNGNSKEFAGDKGADTIHYTDKGDTHTDPNCPCRLLDEQSGESKSSDHKHIGNDAETKFGQIKNSKRESVYSDKGGASRFFYQAKVSKAERNMGLDGFEEKEVEMIGQLNNSVRDNGTIRTTPEAKKNFHPTVKPINLMAYLCRLITPEGGIVLDPFCGSGSTGVAALLEGFRFVGMEMDADYFKIAEARIDSYEKYNKFKK